MFMCKMFDNIYNNGEILNVETYSLTLLSILTNNFDFVIED